MASNVIVEDESGNPITYKDVSTVSLDTEDGGAAVFVNANDIPEQVQADMAQTDATAVDFVKNQYFGMLPDNFKAQELTFETSPDTDKLYYVKGFSVAVPLIIGQAYIVTWGDTECELVAKDMAEVENSWNTTLASAPYLGNSYLIGLAFGSEEWGENTGEPFYINDQYCCATDLTATTRVVGIRLANNTKKLDAQWLPDGIATEAFVEERIAAIEIPEGSGGGGSSSDASELLEDVLESQEFLAETTFTNEYFEFYGTFGIIIEIDEAVYNAWDANTKPVIVRYDGEEYVLEPQRIDPFQTGVTGVGVGNLAAFGGVGNGEPFAIAAMFDEYDGVKSYGLMCGSMVDTSETEHTVAIDLQVETQKIKEEYLSIDTELSETSENPVQNKVITQVVAEAGAAMEELGAAIETMAPYLTPAVTASDDGKFLQVVGGEWQAVALTDVSVEGA